MNLEGYSLGAGASGAQAFPTWLADQSWRWSEGCDSVPLRWCQVRVCGWRRMLWPGGLCMAVGMYGHMCA